jgi:phage shock protein PspC (stress-responsive transcriptional regulator)
MVRSFDNRIFGGVCGGLQALTRLNAWLWRCLWLILVLVTGGLAGLAYLILWWLVPQRSPTQGASLGLMGLVAWLTALGLIGLGFVRDAATLNGISVVPSLVLLLLALIYLYKEWMGQRGRALWGLVAVLAAVLLALAQLNLLASGIGDVLLRALPIVLVFVGLSLLFRQRFPLGNLLALGLSVALAVGVATYAFSVRETSFRDENQVEQAQAISPRVTTLQVNLETLESDVQVFSAPQGVREVRLRYVGSLAKDITPDYRDYGDGLATYTLREALIDPLPQLERIGRGTLTLELPQGVALAFAIKGTWGTLNLDLDTLDLERLNLDLARGSAIVSLPSYQPLSPSVAQQPGQLNINEGDLRLVLADDVGGEFLLSKASNQRPLINDVLYALEDNLNDWRLVARQYNALNIKIRYVLNVPRGSIRLESPNNP